MSETPPALPAAEPPSLGRIFGGVMFTLLWALLHAGLFYLLFASGAIIDILLGVVKAVLFPGLAQRATGGVHEWFGWTGLLLVALCLAGSAGVPAGWAIIARPRRRPLWRAFWLLLLAGVVGLAGAFFILVRNAFSMPS